MSSDKTTTYKGKNIDVQWDSRLCIHIGECGYSEGELFVGGRDPWCQPDLVADDEVKDIVKRCPSGALTYNDKAQGDNETPVDCNTVQVAYNGPLYVQGELHIENAPEDMPGVRYRAALCRCGQSNNKPFCDNSHLKAGFEDYGAVGEAGDHGRRQHARECWVRRACDVDRSRRAISQPRRAFCRSRDRDQDDPRRSDIERETGCQE